MSKKTRGEKPSRTPDEQRARAMAAEFTANHHDLEKYEEESVIQRVRLTVEEMHSYEADFTVQELSNISGRSPQWVRTASASDIYDIVLNHEILNSRLSGEESDPTITLHDYWIG